MRNDFYVGYYNDSVYLAHHGILGMHWGRRNGPPYPLDAADHSQSEKKAGWRKSLGDGRNEDKYDRRRKKISDKYDKKISRVQKDIDSFNPIKEGYKDKNGRTILSKQDVSDSVKGLENKKRDYQNQKDAALKGFDKVAGERTYKQLKKEVRNKRSEVHGGANRWMSGKPIGKYSKALQEEISKKRKEYESTPEYKEWLKKYNSFEKEASKKDANGTLDFDWYDKKQKELWDSRPSKNFNDTAGAVKYSSKGREYVNNYINKGGKDLSMAYLKDLGYSEEVAKKLIKRMSAANRTLGMI